MNTALIGKTITHQLTDNWIGLEIVEANPDVAAVFKKGTVIIKNVNGQYRGLCESMEQATKLTQIYGPHAYFPLTAEDTKNFCVQMSQAEAIRIAEISGGNLWVRPSTWKYGSALAIERGEFKLIPTSRGGVPAQMPSVNDMLASWEVVSPEVVIYE